MDKFTKRTTSEISLVKIENKSNAHHIYRRSLYWRFLCRGSTPLITFAANVTHEAKFLDNEDWNLLQDSAPTHEIFIVYDFLAE